MPVKKFPFRGLMAPVFTPFDQNGNIDLKVIETYASYLYENEIYGILVNGTTGEGTSMTRDERCTVLGKWTDVRKQYTVLNIMAQVGGTNLTDVKFLASDAERKEVNAILCLPDLFFKPSNLDDLISYLQIVSKSAPQTPLLYYHIPSYTGVRLNMKELMQESYKIPNFVGIKFTDEDLQTGSMCVSENFKNSAVFLGCDELFLLGLSKGFNSAISTSINLFPKLHKNILRLYQNNKLKEAQLEQGKLSRNILKITKHGSWVSSMKGAMRQTTDIDVGYVRPPLTDVNFLPKGLSFEKPICL